MWAKYGQALPPVAAMNDPKTGQRPAFNLFNAAGYGLDVPNFGTTVDAVVGRGVHIAVCQMATKFFAGLFAKAVGGTPDGVYSELTGSVFNNSHMVSAGIVAVNRAQEHGYTLAAAG
jgi:intracellular sulfur oxidation DsrE/DsrF family protein